MDLGLKGRTVIVTGASGGIGRHIARRYEEEGAHVVRTYHSHAGGDDGTAMRFDLGDPGSARELVDTVLARTGRIDVLINNAVRWGATGPDGTGRFEDAPDDEWQTMLRTNLEGTLRLTRLVVP